MIFRKKLANKAKITQKKCSKRKKIIKKQDDFNKFATLKG